MTNYQILEDLHNALSKPYIKHIQVTRATLISRGWKGTFPTQIYSKFNPYWIRLDMVSKNFLITKVDITRSKNEASQALDGDAPLNLNMTKKINLKDMYKDKIKGKTKKI